MIEETGKEEKGKYQLADQIGKEYTYTYIYRDSKEKRQRSAVATVGDLQATTGIYKQR